MKFLLACFWTIPPVPGFPEELQGKRFCGIAAGYFGPVEEGEKILKPLRELGVPLMDMSSPIPWTVLNSMFDHFSQKEKICIISNHAI